MKRPNSLIAAVVVMTSLGITVTANIAKADTVNARCDVYPKGEDRATASGACTFSQRQGAVGIQLQDGTRYDLRPVGDQPGNYLDQNGQPAYRQSGLGEAGQIYRLATESVYVYWDPAPYNSQGGNSSSSSSSSSNSNQSHSSTSNSSSTITPASSTNIALVGKPVDGLSDLIGARAGQAENAVTQRGYQFVRSETNYDGRVFGYWREPGSGLCVSLITKEGRYDNIVYSNVSNQTECR